MVRGIENVVKGRDPRDVWAFVQRTCGVCTTVHALTSVRAVEDALGIAVPQNAEYVRNIMEGALYMHDHAVLFHFITFMPLAVEVDVVNALKKADPKDLCEIAQSIFQLAKKFARIFSRYTKKCKKFV
ncbi:MAG: nickel-dependent hydrogenase large subunit [Marinilabiliales bacterium]|nr:nickel-dependent hydrogenase large subunit [Marinilabiliales bacterium]